LRLFIYAIVASLGIIGLAIGLYPMFLFEIFFGWLLPAFAGTVTMYFVLSSSNKEPTALTKILAIGFAIKMLYYGIVILLLIKLYAFEPIPFICSFSGFFMGLHAIEAVIIKRISN
tara:strand:+ start:951 stop:1298 length:348 start_codon:yes stop_codon:yes gene_type:complete